MPKRILVVDDDPTLVTILTKRLVAQGYMVLSAFNGSEALSKASRHKPDVILMDVMMPGMDGVKAAEQLAAMGSTATIPIIFLSALIPPEHPKTFPGQDRLFYLSKPCEPEELLGLLKRLDL